MELNYLQVFFEVAKAGRFTEAAKRLNISQSALSRSVALLEESAGAQLFERSKKGVELTPIGVEVFRQCEILFQTVHKIQDVCKGVHETCEGPLHFATTDHIVSYILPRPLLNFRADYPLVIPSIFLASPDEILQRLLHTECEFTLSFAKVPAPQVEFEALRDEPMALVVRSEIWKKARSANRAAALNKVLDDVGYISSIGAFAQTRPSRVLKELFGRMPPVSVEVNGQEAQKQLCLAGAGVAYLARFMVAREIENGQLHEINVEKTHTFAMWLAVRRGHELSLAARKFIELLKSQI
jgi:LysR family transcriptional regulator, cyn operon transcriptional activator